MKKLVRVIVEDTCHDCPFLSYDSHYGMSYDSGYDCEKIGRVVNDCKDETYRRDLKIWEASQNTLFPKPKLIKPIDPFIIPENCPLETVES